MKTTDAKPIGTIKRYIFLTFGVLLIAVGVYFFKFPNNFSTGGVSGLSLILGRMCSSTVLTPSAFVFIINMALLVVGFIISIQAAGDPTSTLATVTSYIPGLSPLVMPVRMAAGEAAWWEVGLAVVLMLVAIGLIVRLGGRVYAGALLRTGGKIKMREALQAERG